MSVSESGQRLFNSSANFKNVLLILYLSLSREKCSYDQLKSSKNYVFMLQAIF